ncbi:signal peptide peptidase SppA, partial [Candidatus Woesearchaeota archaeon]|nr:signal peptide peptidase SppA [Candidatus Woesearchaeota archaeon]
MVKSIPQPSIPWARIVAAVIIVAALASGTIVMAAFIGVVLGGDIARDGNVAVIPIRGVLMVDRARGFPTQTVSSSTDLVKLIEEANAAPSIKAIIIDINSPGGSATASAEVADALKRSNKTVVAVVREVGASGAYWVASASDKIYAGKTSVVGSIGVIGSYVEYAGLMDRYNLTYRRLVAGNYKDAGSPFKHLTSKEEKRIQDLIDQLHTYFIDEVAINRNLSQEKVRSLADGFILLGKEAKDKGLIDEIGGRKEAEQYLRSILNETISVTEYKRTPS